MLSLAEILTAPRFLAATAVYGLASVGATLLVAALGRRLDDRVSHWLLEHFYGPVLRAAALVAFLLVAYPVLYGLPEAPPLGALLGVDAGRVSLLLGVLFAASVLLPLVPVGGLGPALVLPLQGLAAGALLFSWAAEALGAAPVGYWPGLPVAAGVAAIALASHPIALAAVEALGDAARRRGLEDADEVVHDLVVLLLQVPAVVLYTRALGLQLG
jgi:hypothetical protein